MQNKTVMFSYENNDNEHGTENFQYVFTVNEEDSYNIVLEKVELLLHAMGFVLGNKMILAVNPEEDLVSDIKISRNLVHFPTVSRPDTYA
jgi:hypothetical protein